MQYNIKTGTLKEIIDHYHNNQGQVDIAIEEMSELTKALLKERRALLGDTEKWWEARENIAEEMADVQIMLCQLTMIFNNKEAVQKQIDRKLDRQIKRIREEA